MPDDAPTFLLHDARVLEQDGGFSDETDVLVEGGVVSAVGAALSAPPGAPVYDFSGLWLMPGVFDCHAHVAMSTMNESELLRAPVTYRRLRGRPQPAQDARRRRDASCATPAAPTPARGARSPRGSCPGRACRSASSCSARRAGTATCTRSASASSRTRSSATC